MEDRCVLEAMYACMEAKKNYESVRSNWNETELKVAEDTFLSELDDWVDRRIQREAESRT